MPSGFLALWCLSGRGKCSRTAYVSLLTQVEVEHITIQSPAVGRATVADKKGPDGRPTLIPPQYALDVKYERTSNAGKNVLVKKNDRVVLGHFGEWFTEDGEFVEPIFQQRLYSSLQRIFGE